MLRTVLAVLVGGCLLAACGSEQTAEEEPLRLPEREETWVKSEKVETTRDEVAASQQKTKIDIPIDQDLREKLMEASGPAPATPVTDAASCRAMLDPLNQSRMALQKHGGAWHAFERSPLAKPFSNNGMQLDSNLNKLVFSLRYLCRTAQGVPLNSLAKRVGAIMDEKGKENAREHFIEVVGEAPKDVDDWINYTEFARKNQTRKVP
ncbi:MAG: hypothetical protein GWN10_04975, partial [Nitrospinaceae bacterium]|nr:hypothetical protein [Nitrospinaceae bacterium]NIX33705.1 hypothetical protein [Nitrospinaceae bacterium]